MLDDGLRGQHSEPTDGELIGESKRRRYQSPWAANVSVVQAASGPERGIIGTYHHVSPQHLKRYLGEFDFRYSERSAVGVSDAQRAGKALAGIVGKRLTYRRTNREGSQV